MDGFTADPAELDKLSAAATAMAADLTQTALNIGACAPDAGASSGESAGALGHLAHTVRTLAARFELEATALREAAASYRAADTGASNLFARP